jgi:hypothetical protein
LHRPCERCCSTSPADTPPMRRNPLPPVRHVHQVVAHPQLRHAAGARAWRFSVGRWRVGRRMSSCPGSRMAGGRQPGVTRPPGRPTFPMAPKLTQPFLQGRGLVASCAAAAAAVAAAEPQEYEGPPRVQRDGPQPPLGRTEVADALHPRRLAQAAAHVCVRTRDVTLLSMLVAGKAAGGRLVGSVRSQHGWGRPGGPPRAPPASAPPNRASPQPPSPSPRSSP